MHRFVGSGAGGAGVRWAGGGRRLPPMLGVLFSKISVDLLVFFKISKIFMDFQYLLVWAVFWYTLMYYSTLKLNFAKR